MMIMIIFIQKRDRRYRKIIYNKKNLVPNMIGTVDHNPYMKRFFFGLLMDVSFC